VREEGCVFGNERRFLKPQLFEACKELLALHFFLPFGLIMYEFVAQLDKQVRGLKRRSAAIESWSSKEVED
jgi:hypothetical protein